MTGVFVSSADLEYSYLSNHASCESICARTIDPPDPRACIIMPMGANVIVRKQLGFFHTHERMLKLLLLSHHLPLP